MNGLKYIKLAKLVSKVKDNDTQAFADLYSLTYQKVYFLSLSILKNKQMTEDAVQEVFIIVLKSINKLENPKLFLAWLNKITYNYCIREISKTKKLGEVSSDNIFPIACDESEDTNPLDSYISKENSNELMSLINKLSEIHSTILVLRYFEELKISEIAYVLNISEGTVKSRLNNAKKNLHKLYVSEKEKSTKLYAFLLYPLFKKASNDNMLSYDSSKSLFKNVLNESDNKSSDNIEFKPSSKYNIANYMPFSLTSSIVLTTALICTYGIVKYPLNKDLSNLDINKSNPNNNIIVDEKNNVPKNMDILGSYKNADIFISDISKPTNKPIFIDIKFKRKPNSNDVYIEKSNGEKILGSYVDSSVYRFKINENDEYNLFIKFKNNSTIEKKFKVSCIDTDGPDISDYSFNNNELTIKLKDSVANIDFNKIFLKDSNGKSVDIKSIDKANNSIVINVDDKPLYLIVSDSSGNEVIYTIKSF